MPGAIDTLCNPFTPSLAKRFWTSSEELRQVAEWWHMGDRVRGYEVNEFMDVLDEAGVDKVLVPSEQVYSSQNKCPAHDFSVAEIAEITAKRPDRVKGLYGINPFRKMAGVRELERAVKEFGFVGAHLHAFGYERAINHRDFWPYYAKCDELGIPVLIQVGHSAEPMPSELGRPIYLDDITLYFPSLKVVGIHTGWPWCEELISMAWKFPNVYIGTSAHRPRYWDRSLVAFMNSRGMGKVMFGTDFPVVLHKDALDDIDKLGLKDEAKQQLLWGAATKIFKF